MPRRTPRTPHGTRETNHDADGQITDADIALYLEMTQVSSQTQRPPGARPERQATTRSEHRPRAAVRTTRAPAHDDWDAAGDYADGEADWSEEVSEVRLRYERGDGCLWGRALA